MKNLSKMILAATLFGALGAMAQMGTPNPAAPSATSGVTGVGPMTDAQIASVLQMANKSEAEAGVLAVSKATNPEVKSFAQMMVDDHKMGLEETNKLINDSKLKPHKNTTALDVKATGAMAKKDLEKLSGAEFDKAYINSQIAAHANVLKTIDTQLMPSAKSADVKALLQKTRPKIEAHMKHAEEIRKKL